MINRFSMKNSFQVFSTQTNIYLAAIIAIIIIVRQFALGLPVYRRHEESNSWMFGSGIRRQQFFAWFIVCDEFSPCHGRVRGEHGGNLRGVDARGVTSVTSRKVRTPQGRIPGESRGGRLEGRSTDSATENIPPPVARPAVRVKWWGKGPPPARQRAGQGKPNPVQDQIGDRAARPMIPGESHPPRRESAQAG